MSYCSFNRSESYTGQVPWLFLNCYWHFQTFSCSLRTLKLETCMKSYVFQQDKDKNLLKFCHLEVALSRAAFKHP